MTTHSLARDLDHVLTHTRDLWESMRGQSVFITGGTGFIGTWLLESLCWANDRLDLRVNSVVLTRNPEAFRAKAPYAGNHDAIRFLIGDATSFEFPGGEFPFVIHAATERGIAPTKDHPVGTYYADVSSTRRVLDFARSHGAKRVLFTSSGAVYGRQPDDLAQIPEDYVGAPLTTDANSSYGQAKRASEYLSVMYARQYGFDALIARLFAFVGPHLPLDKFAVGNFLRDALQGKPIEVTGDGKTVRSYLYAADLAIWLWTILVRGESATPYNVGSDQAITVKEVAEKVASIAEPVQRVFIAGDATVPSTRYVSQISRAERELGLRSLIPLEEGLRRTLQWHRREAVVFGQELQHG